jgi:hypothetical protein
MVEKSLSNASVLCLGLVIWIIYEELMYSLGLIFGSSYHQLGVQSSTYPRQVDIDDIGKGYRTSMVDSMETQRTSTLCLV